MNLTNKDLEVLNIYNITEDFLNDKIDKNNFIIQIKNITPDLYDYYYNIDKKSLSSYGRDYKSGLFNNLEKIIVKYSIAEDDKTMDYLYGSLEFRKIIESHFHYIINNYFHIDHHKTLKVYDDYFAKFCIRKNIKYAEYISKVACFRYLDKHKILKDINVKSYFDNLFYIKDLHNKRCAWVNFVDIFQQYDKNYNYDFLYKYIKNIYGEETWERFINTVRLTEKEMYFRGGLNDSNLLEQIKDFKKGDSHLKVIWDCEKYYSKDISIYLDDKNNFYDIYYSDLIIHCSPDLKKHFTNLNHLCFEHKKNDFLTLKEQKEVKKIIDYWNINKTQLTKNYLSYVDYYINRNGSNVNRNILKKLRKIFEDYKDTFSNYKQENSLFKTKLFLGKRANSKFFKHNDISYIIEEIDGVKERIIIKLPLHFVDNFILKYNKINREPIFVRKYNIIILKYDDTNYNLLMNILH